MARRRNSKDDNNLFIVLMDLPWQVSAVHAIVVFSIMRWLIPMLTKSVILTPIGNMVSGLAPIAASVFLFIAVISFFRNRTSGEPRTISPDQSPVERTTSFKPHNTNSEVNSIRITPELDPTVWSIELLRSLEWKRFEMLCAEYFKVLGKRVETITHGADGGIDARVYKNDSDVVESFIQCKSWNKIVGVAPVRELFGVMAHESTGKGIFMATSTFSDDAQQFAKAHSDKLFLIDGVKFVSLLSALPEDKRKRLLEFATEGDYTTPSCASCGIKLVRRTGKTGDFWGCKNYPRCKATLKISSL